MPRKANKTTPTVIDGTLYTNDLATTGIRLNEPAWLLWLEDASAFYYSAQGAGFSVRKQKHRNGYFWYAYKRIGGKLHKRYIGPRGSVTAARLAEIREVFARLAW